MKELFSKTAFGEKRDSQNNAGFEEMSAERAASAWSTNRASSVRSRFFDRILKYRFAISCAAIFVLAAVIIAVILSGANRAGATSGSIERDAFGSAVPTETVEPTRESESAQPAKLFKPETPEPYEEIITPVPELTPAPLGNDDDILVEYGEHNELIPAVQERLMILWYMDQDEPTDYLGSVTTGALEVFQRRMGFDVTGTLDVKTYTALFDDSAKSYLCMKGDEGSDVESVQNRLYELGYLEKRTGVFDEQTEQAVIQFQTANKLDADGMVGRYTREELYNPDCVPKAWSVGDSGEQIKKYQQRLQSLGYLTTEPDGLYGKDTQMAVRRFQMQNSLIEDGYLGPTTRERLMSDDAVGNALSYAMQGSDVLNVQIRLYELNYMRAQDVNSYFTSITERAVKLFQKNNKLSVDGKVGRNTMSVLMSDDAVRASSPVTGGGNSGGGGNNGGGNSGGGNNGGGNNGGGNNGGGNNGGDVASKINRFISVARSKLGSRYVRGGKGPNVFDCSGFVYWCLNQSGVSQSYMTSYMWRSCTRYQRNNSINSVKRGDVIVYYGHVAICSGSWTMIDASQSKGKVVERGFNSNYWHRNFICSFRIFT